MEPEPAFFFLVLVLAAVALGLRTAGARAVQKLASPQHCYNSTIKNMSQFTFFFILASTKLTAINIYLKDNFSSGSRSQIILAPPTLAPARQHWFFHSTLQFRFVSLVKCFVSRNTKHTKLTFAC